MSKYEEEIPETTMEVRQLTKNKESGAVSFLLKDSTVAFANTLRRTIIHDVPTMAIHSVSVKQNSSVLYDEMITLRLGLIPLKTDLQSYNVQSECTCAGAGCAKCTLKLSLKAKGPGIVTAGQMESQDPKVVPVFQDIPMVKLLRGQELEFEATAVLGRGADHIKWSPGLAWYKYKPTVEIEKNPEDPEFVAKGCSVHVFDVKNGKLTVNKDNHLNCHLCGECIERSEGSVQVMQSETDFVFFVEPFGQLSAAEMVSTGLFFMQKKVDVFADLLKKNSDK